MRKGLVTLLVIALVAFFAVYFFIIRQPDNGLPDFSYPTEHLTQIYLVDRLGNDIQLNKNEKGVWIVDQRYEANESLMERLLYDIENQENIGRVTQSKRKLAKENLEKGYVKVRLYEENQMVKEYYIGGPDESNKGNYMSMPPLQDIYDVQLPDGRRNMKSDYSLILNAWRSIWFLDIPKDDIRKVSIAYVDSPQHSFELTTHSPDYTVTGNPPIDGTLNVNRVNEYLTFFEKVSFATIAHENTDRSKELAPQHKYATMIVTQTNGREKRMEIFLHPHTESSKNPVTDPNNAYDADLLYVLTPADDELYVVTWGVFGKLLRHYSEFYQN